jgi:hypothetical protein
MTTWFCDAYASWQKGGVENANGRLRRWLPRHIDIDSEAIPKARDLASAEFATLRLRLINIAARCHRNRQPRAARLRRLMSRSRSVPQPAGCAHPARTVNAGA